jgi:DNA-binding NarL/FixJ family response regulator
MTSDCGSILVVAGDETFREQVARMLVRAGFSAVEVATGEDALEAARRDRLALVLLEVELPGVSGFEICHELRSEHGEELPIIFVSGERVEPVDRVAGLLIGGDDYLVKPLDLGELIARVRRLVARAGLGRPSENGHHAFNGSLTVRELEILRLLAAGNGQAAIAQALFISPKTVSTHIQRILTKLGVHSRAEAIAAAYRAGLMADKLPSPSG